MSKSLRLDSMRWIEVVSLLEHLEGEVAEHAREPLGDLSVLVGIAETPRSKMRRFESCRGNERSEWSLNFSPHSPAELAIRSRSSDGSPTDRPARRTLRPAAIFLAM